ncbi:MAG: DNA-3-methyladenine glycosylase [Acidobacteriota bacterium]|nr:DNA-3-methyladenine glycosylase [Acidobacteriota bacterium]
MEKEAKIGRSAAARQIKGRLLPRSFYEASPELVAPCLLGKLLAHHTSRGVIAGRIVEVEAYLGPHHNTPDPASHSYRGPTPRNQVMFGPPGHAYVYAIYGMHFCMNVTCDVDGVAGGILIRALEPVVGLHQMARNRGLGVNAAQRLLTSGPGRLCQALGLTREAHNGLDLTKRNSPLQIIDDKNVICDVAVTVRIGIRNAVDLPLRFTISGHTCVSGPRNLAPKRIFTP